MSKLTYVMMYLTKFFDGNEAKVQKWLNSPNRNLGNAIPKDLIANGRVDKVYDFVRAVEGGHF